MKIKPLICLEILLYLSVVFLVSSIRASGATITLRYDSLNRLIKADYGTNSVINYTYDAAGNRLTTSSTPSNDNFSQRILLAGASVTANGYNAAATREAQEPNIVGTPGGASVWWSWTAPFSGYFRVSTANSSFDTLLGVYTGSSVATLSLVAANDDQSSGGPYTSLITFYAQADTTYQIVVDGYNGATGDISLSIANVPEAVKPTVSVTYPSAGARLSDSAVTILGQATDNVLVTGVQYSLNGGPFQTAVGTVNWSASISLAPGTNTIVVKSTDFSGNESLPVTRNFSYVLTDLLSVSVNGIGTVTPALDGSSLEIGRNYTLTASPGTGQLFSNWSGSVTSSNRSLTFLMQSNMVLQANFVPNPFIPTRGVYNGLFFESDAVRQRSSGFVTMTLASNGVFSGRLLLDGGTNAFSGKFDLSGQAQTRVVRTGKPPLTNSLHLDAAAQQINGSVTSSNWIAQVMADRAVFNALTNKALNYAGKYTMAIPGGNDPAMSPGGDGYATLSISLGGGISMAGRLADGAPIKQVVGISKDGHWPLYVPLYAGKGSVLGWVTFSNELSSSLSGDLSWIRPAMPSAKYYPNGFTNDTTVIGSSFQTPTNNSMKLLNLTNGIVILSDGNLSDALTNSFVLNANNSVTVSGTNRVAVRLNKTNGLVSGSFFNPATRKTNTFNGVVLQKQVQGGGFFLGTNQSGEVLLQGN